MPQARLGVARGAVVLSANAEPAALVATRIAHLPRLAHLGVANWIINLLHKYLS